MSGSFVVEERQADAGDGADPPGVEADLIEAFEADFEVGVGLLG